MVLLKEISEGIWGLTVEPNKISEVVNDHPFRLTMAALEIDEENDSTTNRLTRVTIKSNTADKGPPTDLILCNLHYPSCLQQPLDIEFHEGQKLSFFVKGKYKVHLTGYVLPPEAEEIPEESHLTGKKHRDLFTAEVESSSEDDDDESEKMEDFHLTRRHRLRDDEDQDLEGDYEDGYLEGEDQLTSSSSSSSSDSDNDEKQKLSISSNKGKKRSRSETNGHPTKQEPETKKVKKTKKSEKNAAATTSSTEENKKSNNLEINDLKVGNGPEAKIGKTAAVYYTGRLKSNNSVFDSCTKGKPFRFRLGAGEVIRGWDQGIKGMRVGGKRRLTIPPSLAYGSKKLPDIPSNSTLVFDVELKNIF